MIRRPWRRDAARRAMDCAEAAREIQAFVDGEADSFAAVRLAAHLEHCGWCAFELATYREIKAALARRRSPDPEAVRRLGDFGASLPGGGPQPGE
ncbi:anti-sigma factor family protein [Streptomyces sp. NBC_01803]|uniref:anti-sigma factor family protein n=1 Tax=Streptomyces sp. NBC_01803 TaxID=2975946 RepID=UPI002DDA80F6|nr:zf-HC2 domain-containing protein [Streptomyces sp. NBC_01803]WSA43151.1 zf-HC2 domain-containing protein [Streptomyces sp. NBC_01803]